MNMIFILVLYAMKVLYTVLGDSLFEMQIRSGYLHTKLCLGDHEQQGNQLILWRMPWKVTKMETKPMILPRRRNTNNCYATKINSNIGRNDTEQPCEVWSTDGEPM